jgi:hypothetical protein
VRKIQIYKDTVGSKWNFFNVKAHATHRINWHGPSNVGQIRRSFSSKIEFMVASKIGKNSHSIFQHMIEAF